MKKNLLLLFVFMMFIFHGNAQTADQVKTNFKSIVLEAATDFKNIQGAVLENDAANKTAYYATSKSLGSTFEAICVNSNDNTTYFSSKFEYSKTAELVKANEILPGILDEVNTMVKSGKYKGRDYNKSAGVDITEVKDLEGNYIVEIETKYEASGNNNYLMITIFGKSWGKK
jgi:hypothetical protein